MSDLKPCPFCGGKASQSNELSREMIASCDNPYCANFSLGMAVYEWNHRPIEDALNTTLAQQQAEIGRLREALAWYADEANYEIGIYDSEINANEAPPIWDDGGLKAREVLKGGAG